MRPSGASPIPGAFGCHGRLVIGARGVEDAGAGVGSLLRARLARAARGGRRMSMRAARIIPAIVVVIVGIGPAVSTGALLLYSGKEIRASVVDAKTGHARRSQ